MHAKTQYTSKYLYTLQFTYTARDINPKKDPIAQFQSCTTILGPYITVCHTDKKIHLAYVKLVDKPILLAIRAIYKAYGMRRKEKRQRYMPYLCPTIPK